jgi:hypothetical protein
MPEQRSVSQNQQDQLNGHIQNLNTQYSGTPCPPPYNPTSSSVASSQQYPSQYPQQQPYNPQQFSSQQQQMPNQKQIRDQPTSGYTGSVNRSCSCGPQTGHPFDSVKYPGPQDVHQHDVPTFEQPERRRPSSASTDFGRYHRRNYSRVVDESQKTVVPDRRYLKDRWVTEQRDSYVYYGGEHAQAQCCTNRDSKPVNPSFMGPPQNQMPSRDYYWDRGYSYPSFQDEEERRYPPPNVQPAPSVGSARRPSISRLNTELLQREDAQAQQLQQQQQPQNPSRPKSVGSERPSAKSIRKVPSASNSGSATPRSARGGRPAPNPEDEATPRSASSRRAASAPRRPEPIPVPEVVPVREEEDQTHKMDALNQNAEHFRQTRSKIKELQQKQTENEQHYQDDYYINREQLLNESLRKDQRDLNQYIPAQGRAPFHNYGWANQQPIREHDRMRTFNIMPRDVYEVYPNIVNRRERTKGYEGWKKYLEGTIGYKMYRPKAYFNKSFSGFSSDKRVSSRQANRNKTSSGMMDVMQHAKSPRATTPSKKKPQREQQVQIEEPQVQQQIQQDEPPHSSRSTASGRRVTSTKTPVDEKDLHIQIPQARKETSNSSTPRQAGNANALNVAGVKYPQEVIDRDDEAEQQKEHFQQMQQRGNYQQQQQYMPSRYEANYMEDMQSPQQYDSYDPGMYRGQLQRSWTEKSGEGVGTNEGYPKAFYYSDQYQRYDPMLHREQNPRYYKNLPPAYLNYIRAAGLKTPTSAQITDCMKQYD